MTARRPQRVAYQMSVRLERLAQARKSQPGRPGTLEPSAGLALVLLAATESALVAARLCRQAETDPAADRAHRQRGVILGACVAAFSDDLKSGTSDATGDLFKRLTHEAEEI